MGELNRLIPGYLTHSLEVGTRSDLEREEVNGLHKALRTRPRPRIRASGVMVLWRRKYGQVLTVCCPDEGTK